MDPEFTSVVWQKLEEQNPSFFRAYNLQLQLKEQILAFNYLVRKEISLLPFLFASLHIIGSCLLASACSYTR